MKLVLLKDVKHLGKVGDEVNVKGGFARNYLLPSKSALTPTEENLEIISKMKDELMKKEQEAKEAALAIKEKLLGYKQVYDLNDFAINGFWPEKVILLDIDPKISLSRQKVADRIGSDQVSFFNKVRDGYLQLAEEFSEKFLVLNAENSQQENFNHLSDWLNLERT